MNAGGFAVAAFGVLIVTQVLFGHAFSRLGLT